MGKQTDQEASHRMVPEIGTDQSNAKPGRSDAGVSAGEGSGAGRKPLVPGGEGLSE